MMATVKHAHVRWASARQYVYANRPPVSLQTDINLGDSKGWEFITITHPVWSGHQATTECSCNFLDLTRILTKDKLNLLLDAKSGCQGNFTLGLNGTQKNSGIDFTQATMPG